MNINDYDTSLRSEDSQSHVEYVRSDYDLENRYPINTPVCIKGRRDLMGLIDRIEGENIIVKIFNETYSIPHQSFDLIFFMHNYKNVYNKKSKERKK